MKPKIENDDIKLLEIMAKKYDMNIVEFGKTIISYGKKNTQQIFRVSESEYDEIAKKAEQMGMNISRYCEYSCTKFLQEKTLDEYFYYKNKYGNNRSKRIGFLFRNKEIESKFLKFTAKYDIEIGTLIRYCVLMNDGEV